MKSTTKGAFLASAVALMFMANGVLAQEKGTTSSGGATTEAKVKCVGGNDCKGKGSCKSAEHDCKGMNSCKGKGFVMSSTEQECKDKGGKPEAEKM